LRGRATKTFDLLADRYLKNPHGWSPPARFSPA
jgi:hypothetical protein